MDFNELYYRVIGAYSSRNPHQREEARRELHDPLSFEAAKLALKAKKQEQRLLAVKFLGLMRTPEAFELIIEAVKDRASNVRLTALNLIENYTPPAALQPVIGVLLTDRSSYVRKHAAIALGSMGSVEAVPHLLEALKTDDSSYVRYESVRALAEIGHRDAVPGLAQALIEDDNSYVRYAAAKALEEIGDEATIPALLAGVCSDNYFVQRAALEALTNIDEDIIGLLQAYLLHESHPIRRLAFNALIVLTVEEDDALIFEDYKGRWN